MRTCCFFTLNSYGFDLKELNVLSEQSCLLEATERHYQLGDTAVCDYLEKSSCLERFEA